MKAMQKYENPAPEEPTLEPTTCKGIPIAMIQGTNRLCCGNRVVLGNDLSYCIGALTLTILPTVCTVYGAVVDSDHWAVAIPPVIMTIIMVSFMWLTAATDPGIVPRDPYPVDVN